MPDLKTILIDRIEERLQALGLTDRKASLDAIGKPDLIRDIRRGKMPGSERLHALAAALMTTVDFLSGRTDSVWPGRQDQTGLPNISQMPRDIPIYGTAIGSDAELYSGGDAVAIEQTDLNTGEVIDYLRRPPAYRDRPDMYSLYTAGTSMEPAFDAGRAVLVDPKRPPSIMDYVVVYLRGGEEHGPSAVLIKRLRRRTADFVELEQFNPASTFRVEKRRVHAIHRVVPWDEALGL